jgi:bifunctional DNase/RNase
MIEMTVDALQMSCLAAQHCRFCEVVAERYLPIWIGQCEAGPLSCTSSRRNAAPDDARSADQYSGKVKARLRYV